LHHHESKMWSLSTWYDAFFGDAGHVAPVNTAN
jgi:hypothetical protein